MRGTVLVIDDDPLQLEVLGDHIGEYAAIDVVKCMNGHDAISVMKEDRDVRLVISDIHMPEIDGIELLQLLAETQNCPPLVLMSGGPDSQLQAARQLATCYGITCLDALRKPVSFSALDRALTVVFQAADRLEQSVRA